MTVITKNEEIEGYRLIPITKIYPAPKSLRLNLDDNYLTELTESIKIKGNLQPILVRPRQSGEYQIIAGEQRYQATKRAGFTTIPCIVKKMDDSEAFEASLIENLHRKNLTDYEIAIALKRLLEKLPEEYDIINATDGILESGMISVGIENTVPTSNNTDNNGNNEDDADHPSTPEGSSLKQIDIIAIFCFIVIIIIVIRISRGKH